MGRKLDDAFAYCCGLSKINLPVYEFSHPLVLYDMQSSNLPKIYKCGKIFTVAYQFSWQIFTTSYRMDKIIHPFFKSERPLLTANESVDDVVIETLCTSKAREVSKLYDKNDAIG